MRRAVSFATFQTTTYRSGGSLNQRLAEFGIQAGPRARHMGLELLPGAELQTVRRSPVRRHLSAALPVGLPRRADDEDLPDETVYPGHALTDPKAGQRSDRFYFINFPAGDGLSAGVECAAVLGNGRRV